MSNIETILDKAKLQKENNFNILTDKKEQILDALFAEELFASSHYKTHAETMNADNLHRNVINLFNDSYYSEEQALRTCEIINKIIKL